MTASRSGAKSAKSRWQWLSTSNSGARRFRLDIARKDAVRRRKRPARGQGVGKIGEAARLLWHRELIEQRRCRIRHKRLRQDPEMPQDFGERVEHGFHPRRVAPPQ